MKNKFVMFATIMVASAGLLTASYAYAATPTLSAFYTGNGDNVQLNVSGADPNQNVLLNNNFHLQAIGVTDSSGSFSATLSTSQAGITPGGVVSVTVNNQTSNSIQWPYTATTGSFSLSQTAVALSIGQSSVVTANATGPFYLSTNSNPSVANISISGSQITVTGNTAGTTNVSICAVANSSSCTTLTVTVSGASGQSIYFSQNNLTLPLGGSTAVTVSGGTGMYTVTGNSNPSIVQATLSGSAVSLSAGSVSGTATVTICSSDMSSCGVINVTVSGTSTNNSMSFNPASPSLVIGQALTVAIIGGVPPYYVSSNSNSGIVQTSISNNIITISGLATGSATVTVCSSGGSSCGTLYVTVTASSGSITLGQTSVTLTSGQSTSVQASGGGGYYIASNSNPNVASAAVNGSLVTISAISAGSDAVNVCSSAGQCAILSISVSSGATTNTSPVVFTEVLPAGRTMTILLSGGQTPYYISSAPSGIFGATVQGNTLTLAGVGAGTGSISVCSAAGSCAPLYVTVSAAVSSSGGTTSSGTTVSSGGTGYVFTTFMTYGDSGTDVAELQKKLTSNGFYSGPLTGYYGDLTTAAVKAFQSAHGISAVGYVGPSTRAALNGQ